MDWLARTVSGQSRSRRGGRHDLAYVAFLSLFPQRGDLAQERRVLDMTECHIALDSRARKRAVLGGPDSADIAGVESWRNAMASARVEDN